MTYGAKLGPNVKRIYRGKANESKPKKVTPLPKSKKTEPFLKQKRKGGTMISKVPLLKGKINGS